MTSSAKRVSATTLSRTLAGASAYALSHGRLATISSWGVSRNSTSHVSAVASASASAGST